jgi:sigma-E factor negative regulatory protein RseA
MQAKKHEKLSLLVDDQLDKAQALSLLKSVQREPELQAKLQRYALISQALKAEKTLVANVDFAERIKLELKSEPVYFLPQKKPADNIKKVSLAVAASAVLAVVWLSAAQLKDQPESTAGVNTLAQNTLQAEQMNAQFKEYLQAHDNAFPVNSNVGVQSYPRMASYQSK